MKLLNLPRRAHALFGATGLALAMSLGLAATPLRAAETAPFVFPELRSAAEITSRCDATLRALAAAEQAAASNADANVNVLAAFDRLGHLSDDALSPISFLGYVHPDKALREAAQACDLRYQAFISKLYQNARIQARLLALVPADAIDARLREDLLGAFEDAGSSLPPAARARARKLNTDMGKLAQTFERRVQEDKTRVAFTEAELQGVDAKILDAAKRDTQGRYLLGMDYPTYHPVRESAVNPQTRERMWRAFNQRGGQANLATLGQLTKKRLEYARLFGLPSYADFALRRRMAGSVERAQSFLGEVGRVAAAREARDIADLVADKPT